MNLSEIPKDTRVVLDTGIFLYAMQGLSVQSRNLLERCAVDEVSGILPSQVLTDVMHGLMIAEAKDNGWILSQHPLRDLKRQPKRIASLRRYESLVRDMMGMGLALEQAVREDYITAMDVQQRSGFLIRDALLIAMCKRLGVHSIASPDPGFRKALGIDAYWPSDVR